ncbi:hypothetical protein EV424DRAFT_1352088 [Suillus variegatus]|nr:hypothetical protein EV424DRAFT_1352088 [Suillus variegatus]
MSSTASQLERSLRRLQISESDSQETSTAVEWVPSKYTSDVSQYVLVRPPRAPCGNRQLFGFPLIKKELWDIGTISFEQIWPDRTLPDDNVFIAMNSLTFVKIYFGLRVCSMALGKVVGDTENIPAECMSSPGKVLLLVLWRNTESEAACPTQSQVHFLKMKLKRSPGWWVEVPVPILMNRPRNDLLSSALTDIPSKYGLRLPQGKGTVLGGIVGSLREEWRRIEDGRNLEDVLYQISMDAIRM